MKKFVVLLVVVALTCITSMAFAASEVSVGGEIAIRSRDFTNLGMNKDLGDSSERDTQQRIKLDVNAKAGDAKGKISIWNYWDTWGRFETPQGNGAVSGSGTDTRLQIIEAWVNFNVPGLPLNVTAGHQMLQLGQGWFFRSKYFGSDAWVIANQSGNNTAAFVDVKVSEGASNAADDIDAYVILDMIKLSDAATVGIDFTNLLDRRGGLGFGAAGFETTLQNLGVNFTGKLGPVDLKAQVDTQMGKAKTAATDRKFKGNEIVVQGNVAMDPVTINFTVGRGTGDKAGDNDYKGFKNFLDINPRYTFLYEYKIGAPAGVGTHKGFANTTALSAGVSFAASKSLTLGADLWILNATEKVPDLKAGSGTTNKLGQEVDLKANWKVADNLSWNWTLGYLKPLEGLSAKGDAAMGAQGILSFTF